MTKIVKHTQKATKIEISFFLFKFCMVELKFAAEIIECCQLFNLLQNSAKVNFGFLKVLETILSKK